MSDETIELDIAVQALRQVCLEVVSGPHQGNSWVLEHAGDFIIGRDHPAHIRLADEAALSQQHLKLSIDTSRIRLLDLQTTNGTWLNGIRVSSANIGDGDRFGVGETMFAIHDQSKVKEQPQLTAEVTTTQPVKVIQNTARVTSKSDPNMTGHDHIRVAGSFKQGMASKLVSPLNADLEQQVVAHTLPLTRPGADPIAAESLFSERSESRQPTEPLQAVGVYDVIRAIGQGGMATVYEVRHRRSGEPFAMKLIRHDGNAPEKQLSLFVREAGLILRLIHPRIVRAFEFGFHETTPFLVMELLPIIDLPALVQLQTREQRIKTSCWVISRVLQALHFAHGENIVHRDVKLGNILSYREGKHLKVKLGDFGLAKSFQDAGLSAMTNEQSIRGTLAYMPPEQLRDSRSAGPLVDLFATGVCLYRLLTGRLPAASFKPGDCEQELRNLSDIPKDLVDVLRISMQRDPAKRYQTAEMMARALFPFHGRP